MMFRRAPYYLRVTECGGEVDALDQKADVPRPDEKLFAYHLTGEPAMCHINSGKRGVSGFYPLSNYTLVTEQPTDEEMRDLRKWEDWCDAHRPNPWPSTKP